MAIRFQAEENWPTLTFNSDRIQAMVNYMSAVKKAEVQTFKTPLYTLLSSLYNVFEYIRTKVATLCIFNNLIDV